MRLAFPAVRCQSAFMRSLFFFLSMLCVAVAKESPQTILESLPATLAGCSRSEYHAYEGAGLGGSVGYNAPGLVVTVYAYDLDKGDIADGIDDPVVRKAFEDANGALLLAKDAGYYSKVERQKDGLKKAAPGALVSRFHLTHAKGGKAGVEVFSETHVFGARGHVIKFRISGDLADEAKHRKILAKLIPALHEAIAKPAK